MKVIRQYSPAHSRKRVRLLPYYKSGLVLSAKNPPIRSNISCTKLFYRIFKIVSSSPPFFQTFKRITTGSKSEIDAIMCRTYSIVDWLTLPLEFSHK